MRIVFAAACALSALGVTLAAAPAQARLVGPGYDKSWGKAGVSLEQYRADAVACGREAAAIDLRDSGPARALVIASRLMDNANDYYSASEAMRIAGLAHNIPKVGDMMQAKLDQCLIGQGYHQFKLTDAQRHHLAKLPTGSLERHSYLHSLASSPQVLERQAVD
jgi:hypothetical protein